MSELSDQEQGNFGMMKQVQLQQNSVSAGTQPISGIMLRIKLLMLQTLAGLNVKSKSTLNLKEL